MMQDVARGTGSRPPQLKMALTLAAGALALQACAVGPTFHLSPQDQVTAEEWAISVRLMTPEATRPASPTAPHREWTEATCHWTWRANVAACETRSRPLTGGPWTTERRRFHNHSTGVWELLP